MNLDAALGQALSNEQDYFSSRERDSSSSNAKSQVSSTAKTSVNTGGALNLPSGTPTSPDGKQKKEFSSGSEDDPDVIKDEEIYMKSNENSSKGSKEGVERELEQGQNNKAKQEDAQMQVIAS